LKASRSSGPATRLQPVRIAPVERFEIRPLPSYHL